MEWTRCLPLVWVAVTACTGGLPHGVSAPVGDSRFDLEEREADGRRRSYRLFVPPHETRIVPAPVVIVLHGAFSSAREIEKRSGFSQLALHEGFVVVYPEGYGFLGLFRHWNAGHCCGRANRLGLDDVAFLDGVLEDVGQRVDVDPSRLYVVGESNGAMLAYLYASVRSRRVAGVGAVAGTIGSAAIDGHVAQIPAPEVPVPVVIVHGTGDASIPFQGGPSDGDESPVWNSVSESAGFWVRHNGTRTDPQITTLHQGQVEKTVWDGGADRAAAPVVLYALAGWPHEWPGPVSRRALEEADPLREFDAARVLWQDLRAFRRQRPDGVQ